MSCNPIQVYNNCSFSSLWKKTEPKEDTPCPASPCASPLRPEHPGTHPPVGGLRQSARFMPSAPSMLGVGQGEIRNPNAKSLLSSPAEEPTSTTLIKVMTGSPFFEHWRRYRPLALLGAVGWCLLAKHADSAHILHRAYDGGNRPAVRRAGRDRPGG